MVTDDTKVTNAASTINLSEGGETKNNLGWALGLGAAIKIGGECIPGHRLPFSRDGKS